MADWVWLLRMMGNVSLRYLEDFCRYIDGYPLIWSSYLILFNFCAIRSQSSSLVNLEILSNSSSVFLNSRISSCELLISWTKSWQAIIVNSIHRSSFDHLIYLTFTCLLPVITGCEKLKALFCYVSSKSGFHFLFSFIARGIFLM